jgi:hypothetical protein
MTITSYPLLVPFLRKQCFSCEGRLSVNQRCRVHVLRTAPYFYGFTCNSCASRDGHKKSYELLGEKSALLRSKVIDAIASDLGVTPSYIEYSFSEKSLLIPDRLRSYYATHYSNHYELLAGKLNENPHDIRELCADIMTDRFQLVYHGCQRAVWGK